MPSNFLVHCPSLQAIVLATRAEVVRAAAREATTLSTDSRDDLRGACFVAIKGERFDGHDFVAQAAGMGAAFAIVERVPSDEMLALLPPGFGLLGVRSTRAALASIAHAWRKSILRLRVVAVTGSAGKTTTRRLMQGILAEVGVAHASPKSFNNDLGVPLTLLSTPDDAAFLVAEIGMNHPGEILPLTELAEPEVAIVTLAGRAHLEGMGSLEAVAREKASILAGIGTHGIGIVNGDNPPLLAEVEELVAGDRAPERIVRFGRGASCHYRLVGREPSQSGQEIAVAVPRSRRADDDAAGDGGAGGDGVGGDGVGGDGLRRYTLRLPGEHNALNALAAIAAATEMGIPDAAIRSGLAKVVAEDMRLERLEIGGRLIFNDAYNANPDAMIASLAAFAEIAAGAPKRVAILGEMLELGPDAASLHAEVGRSAALRLGKGDGLVAVGPHAEALVEGARAAGFQGETLSSAAFSVAFAAEVAAVMPVGTAVLLKGSRGARMERFLDPVRAAFAAG